MNEMYKVLDEQGNETSFKDEMKDIEFGETKTFGIKINLDAFDFDKDDMDDRFWY